MSDKADLKRSKKDAELAKVATDPVKVGQRFFNIFEWGENLTSILLSIEERLRHIEDAIDSATLEMNRYIKSDSIVQVTYTQTINSSAFIGQETTKTINSDSEISS